MSAPLRLFLTAGCLAVTAGCGGGGGGGTEPAPATQQTAAPFALTESMAIPAGRAVFATLDRITAPSELAAFAAQQAPGDPRLLCGDAPQTPVPVTISFADNDGNGAVSSGDTIRYRHDACRNVARDYTFTISTFVGDGQRVDARVEFVETTLSPQATLSGTYNLTFSLTPGSPAFQWSATSIEATLTYSGATYLVRNGRVSKSVNAASQYVVSGSGVLRGSPSGDEFQFATPAAGGLEGTYGQFPSKGEVVLTAGASRLRFAPPADSTVARENAEYQLAMTANGAYGAARQAKWVDLGTGLIFGFEANTAPRITSLTLGPQGATRETPLQASIIVVDPEGDQLDVEYEWRRNGALLTTGTSPQLAPGSYVRGDVVSVHATVSDGRETASASASITIANAPPRIETITLSPASPTTTSDLAVTVVASDPDGDALQFAYQWRRNGTVILGRSANALPHTEHVRDDVIAAIVSVNDGLAVLQGQATVTIQDSPAQLTLVGVTQSLGYGETLDVEIEAHDPDGDPPPTLFRLEHGPSGMTVDPSTGAVSWAAKPLMFDESLVVSFGVGAEGAMPAFGTTTVEDPGRDYPLARLGLEIPVWRAGLTVGDFDGDGDEEALILSDAALYELSFDGADGYRQSWVYPYPFPNSAPLVPTLNGNALSLATADVDGDGHHELFVGSAGYIVRLDGVTRRIVDHVEIDSDRTCRDMELADLDADGAYELACVAAAAFSPSGIDGSLLVYSAANLDEIWRAGPAQFGIALAIGNVDGDPAKEIVAAGGYVIDGITFATEWTYAGLSNAGFGQEVDTGDLDGDGIEEIVAFSNWNLLTAYDAVLRTPLWEVQRFDLDALLVTDIEGDARAEILIGDGQWGDVVAYRVDDGAPQEIFQIDSQNHGVTAMGIGDVDGDGERELIWGTGATSSGPQQVVVAGRNPAIEVEWTWAPSDQYHGAFVGGETARSGGAVEAPLFASGRPVSMDPTSGDVTVGEPIGSSGIEVTDYDGDGTDEAFMLTSELFNGYVAVHDFFAGANDWTTPPLANTAFIDVTGADVSGDGRDDVVALTEKGVVYVYDAFNRSSVWQSTTLGNAVEVSVADVEADGEKELVIVTRQALHVYQRAPNFGFTLRASHMLTNRDFTCATVGDTNGDGIPEIYAFTVPSNILDAPATLVRFDADLELLGTSALDFRVKDVLVEPSGFAHKNLLVTKVIEPFQSRASQIVAIDPASGAEVWRSPQLLGQVQRDSIHVFDTSDGPRLSIGTAGAMYLTR